ncbi:hypothetical protein [Natronoglycomyces albus]|uniref:Uncharacterized protein n=1 Tax=Natronoglycomyces albus TaxID=2811108 RepID=A0A895XVR1_9ACTN|nr:hypothetical protein [Natronoglycomyces albus]QSB05728.1 hypothetical protein JQS30_02020 [Natronoglycomyces albus]
MRKAKFSKSLIFLTGVALIAYLGACSQDDGPHRSPEEVVSTWQENLYLSAQIQEVTERLWYSCAESEGIAPEELPPLETMDIAARSLEDSMGLARPRVDPDTAAEVGFRVYYADLFSDENVTETSGSLTYEQAIVLFGNDYTEAVWGTDEPVADPPGVESLHFEEWNVSIERYTDGCAGYVDELIHNDVRDFMYHQLAATTSMNSPLLESAEFAEGEADWAHCMRNEGYSEIENYHDPFAKLMTWRAESGADFDAFEDRQIELAVADAKCAEAEGVNDLNKELYESFLLEFYAEHEQAFYAYNELATEVLQKAQELLAEGTW